MTKDKRPNALVPMTARTLHIFPAVGFASTLIHKIDTVSCITTAHTTCFKSSGKKKLVIKMMDPVHIDPSNQPVEMQNRKLRFIGHIFTLSNDPNTTVVAAKTIPRIISVKTVMAVSDSKQFIHLPS